METETNKLREDLISMLKDVCFDKPDEKIFELKVLVYKDASGGAPGDDGDSVDGDSVDGDSDDDAASDVESDGDDGVRSFDPAITVEDINLIETPYEDLKNFKLFREICQIFGVDLAKPNHQGELDKLYSQNHFDFYNDEKYDELFKDSNDELLDMYEAVDTMMVGLPYEIIYSDDDQLNKKKLIWD